jgi:hypothetical protein
VVEVTNPAQPLLAQRARAELVAALSMVDYVVLGDGEARRRTPISRAFHRTRADCGTAKSRKRPLMTNPPRILVVRLGSMGDVIAALPAVASLKHSIPHSKITWVIDPKWSLLLEGNPYVDSVVHLDRRTFTGLRNAWRELRAARFDFAVDFQGLVKSALVATLARPERIFGFNAEYARESAASWFYSTKVPIRSYHAVDRNLDLAAAAGASNILRTFPLAAWRGQGQTA